MFTTFLIFLLSTGNIAGCFQYYVPRDTYTYKIFYYYGDVAISSGCGLTILACLFSCFQHFWTKKLSYSPRKSPLSNDKLDALADFAVTRVPALHMLSLCVICVINIYWENAAFLGLSEASTNLTFVMSLFANSLVFVIEMRVRRNEVVSGQVKLDLKEFEVCTLFPPNPHPNLHPTLTSTHDLSSPLTYDNQAKVAEAEATAQASIAGTSLSFFHHSTFLSILITLPFHFILYHRKRKDGQRTRNTLEAGIERKYSEFCA